MWWTVIPRLLVLLWKRQGFWADWCSIVVSPSIWPQLTFLDPDILPSRTISHDPSFIDKTSKLTTASDRKETVWTVPFPRKRSCWKDNTVPARWLHPKGSCEMAGQWIWSKWHPNTPNAQELQTPHFETMRIVFPDTVWSEYCFDFNFLRDSVQTA